MLKSHTSLRERRQVVSFRSRACLPGPWAVSLLVIAAFKCLARYARQTGSPSPRPVDDRKRRGLAYFAGDELGDPVDISHCLVSVPTARDSLSLFNNCLRRAVRSWMIARRQRSFSDRFNQFIEIWHKALIY